MGFAASNARAWGFLPGEPGSATRADPIAFVVAGVPGLKFLAAD